MIPSRSSRSLRAFPLCALLLLAACRRAPFGNYAPGDREFAYVANSGDSTVTVLDLVYLRADRTLSVGRTPTALAASPTRNEVYVLNAQPESATGSLSIIDTGNNTVGATIPLPRNPTAFSVDPTGKRAFIANTGADSVTIVDLTSRRVTLTVATAARPTAALISPDGRTLLVTNAGPGAVTLYTVQAPAGRTPTLVRRAEFPGCPGATAPVILDNSSKAFVACSAGHQVLALSLAANTATADGEWNSKQDPTLLTDHVLDLLEVGENPIGLALKPDSGEVFASNAASDSISEISTETNEVGNTQAIGNRPGPGLISRGNLLWVPNTGADSLTLYSVDDGKIIAGIRTGAGPRALAFSSDEHLLLAADKGSGDVALIRTTSLQGPPGLFTLMPAGASPSAIAIKSMPAKR